ncbi:peroxidase, family 2 domain-containing protein [Hirsutella rhossiliensis]|uniref:Peroxidase, family 2 domain-containing protein n=1 Tax=Hirsutella rhossiliensis TaxID=111463 RepID=A0A9P8N9D8_9HYPO|nr:peroxidase, family 2 domain-containing protein [Hirsutella rhossiliensis]KAH0967032.1 peroxidase, family 2 domain-containing protein [Hirsutella rhossiliensis]
MHALFLAVLALTGLQAAAFPSALLGGEVDAEKTKRFTQAVANMEPRQVPGGNAPGRFNAQQQLVSTTGTHRFIAPRPGDQRGPCPGLNAMANHNYIPRNGVATAGQFIKGCMDVYGMGLDLATFLAEIGAVVSGDLVGLLGRPRGISFSHNKYEADCSPTRGDYFQYGGNAYKLQLSQFQELYDEPLGANGYDVPAMARFHVKRFRQSKENNPYFLHSSGALIVSSATFSFIYRFMGNKSADYPQGYLNQDVLKSFFAITGEPGNFQYTQGHERIPDNWYKRAVGDEYNLVYFAKDLSDVLVAHPELIALGGNLGQVNTFAGVDIGNLTGGVYNAQNLAQGNNAACLGFQLIQLLTPDIVKGLYSLLSQPLARLNDALGNALYPLNCPQLQEIDTDRLNQFPGASLRS